MIAEHHPASHATTLVKRLAQPLGQQCKCTSKDVSLSCLMNNLYKLYNNCFTFVFLALFKEWIKETAEERSTDYDKRLGRYNAILAEKIASLNKVKGTKKKANKKE